MEDLMRRTELEEETIAEVKKILQSEFEDWFVWCTSHEYIQRQTAEPVEAMLQSQAV
jgi:succinate dehydrogenase flavin-adding protein (antitoxin of CptAB toxin-antitoxin module)